MRVTNGRAVVTDSRRRVMGLVACANALVAMVLVVPRAGAGPRAPLVRGLDHVPIAVSDLDAAAERYRMLGFALKPGRSHANGIRNLHVKFRDGTELELITAPEARDALTREYRDHLAHGDGPAFVGFHAPDLTALVRVLDATDRPHRRGGGLVTFAAGDALHYLFFGGRNRSPTDEARHFAHPNGALGLAGVWLAGDDLAAEQRLLEDLGFVFRATFVAAPDSVAAMVGTDGDAEVVLLPGARRLVTGRRIVGAVLHTGDLRATKRVLAAAFPDRAGAVREAGGSVFVAPEPALGLWLEFREARGAPR